PHGSFAASNRGFRSVQVDRSARRATMPAWCMRLWLVAVLLFGALGAGPALAQIAWGVNGHPINSYPGISYAAQLDLLKGLGARSYRVDISNAASGDKLAELI